MTYPDSNFTRIVRRDSPARIDIMHRSSGLSLVLNKTGLIIPQDAKVIIEITTDDVVELRIKTKII